MKPWNPERDEELKAALLKNVSLQRLSVRFGCSVGTIKLHARHLGLELPSKTKMTVEREPRRWFARKRVSETDYT